LECCRRNVSILMYILIITVLSGFTCLTSQNPRILKILFQSGSASNHLCSSIEPNHLLAFFASITIFQNSYRAEIYLYITHQIQTSAHNKEEIQQGISRLSQKPTRNTRQSARTQEEDTGLSLYPILLLCLYLADTYKNKLGTRDRGFRVI
jgi:hypothetical protein